MAHQIYLTEGIILKKKDFGEADRLFYIYTEKIGMVIAVAKGARLGKSKLRYNLEAYSHGEFALIASQDLWRITDAREINTPVAKEESGLEKISKFANFAVFLTRMIKGQEPDDFLWQEIKKFHKSLFGPGTRTEDIKNMEIAVMAKILHNLGYMDNVPEEGSSAVKAINRAIKESML